MLTAWLLELQNSFFSNKVWAPYIAHDADQGYWLAWPRCFDGAATGLTDVWRGVWFTIQGIATGLIIDQTVTVFSLVGEWLAKHANEQTWQGYQLKLVNLSYPLELGVFNFYFWFLAFIVIPFNEELQMCPLRENILEDVISFHNRNLRCNDCCWSKLHFVTGTCWPMERIR